MTDSLGNVGDYDENIGWISEQDEIAELLNLEKSIDIDDLDK